MAPVAVLSESASAAANISNEGKLVVGVPLLEMASAEIERIRHLQQSKAAAAGVGGVGGRGRGGGNCPKRRYHTFPPACLAMLRGLDGNHRCVDCGETNPEWAAVSYGALLCLRCSGHHRSLGVQVSRVRSISMDEWSLEEVLRMLEGGNGQLSGFFHRHHLSEESAIAAAASSPPPSPSQPRTAGSSSSSSVISKENVTRVRYKTKAAKFYRQQMELHVSRILSSGLPYQGREFSRRRTASRQRMGRLNSTTDCE